MSDAGTRSLVVRVLLAVLMLPCSLFFTNASAQEASSYEAELLEWNIEVSGPNYVLQDVALEEYPHGRGERVYIANVENAAFAEVAFFDDEDTPEQTIEVMLRDFESASRAFVVLDSGVSTDIHYALARFELQQGLSGYFYIEVAQDIEGNVDLAQSLYSLDSDFLDQLELARGEVSLAGFPFLAEPVIDLDAIVEADIEMLASTPVPVPTPDQGTYVFESTNAELRVQGEIEFNFPRNARGSDLMFLSSEHGYGVVGFMEHNSESPEFVLSTFFIGAPVGSEAPVEIYTESDESRAFGVYRVSTSGETRAMVIEVVQLDEGVWQVQAMAVTESEFADSLGDYQSGVTLNGEPLLGDVNAEDIVNILNEPD